MLDGWLLAERYGPSLVLLEHHPVPEAGEGAETLDLARIGADGSPHWLDVWPTAQENPRHAGLELWMAAALGGGAGKGRADRGQATGGRHRSALSAPRAAFVNFACSVAARIGQTSGRLGPGSDMGSSSAAGLGGIWEPASGANRPEPLPTELN